VFSAILEHLCKYMASTYASRPCQSSTQTVNKWNLEKIKVHLNNMRNKMSKTINQKIL
jgi:hypothetical protein